MELNAEARRILAVSISKLYASRSQRGGLRLHRSLLLSLVMRSARDIYHSSAAAIERGSGAAPGSTEQAMEAMDTSEPREESQRAGEENQRAREENQRAGEESQRAREENQRAREECPRAGQTQPLEPRVESHSPRETQPREESPRAGQIQPHEDRDQRRETQPHEPREDRDHRRETQPHELRDSAEDKENHSPQRPSRKRPGKASAAPAFLPEKRARLEPGEERHEAAASPSSCRGTQTLTALPFNRVISAF